MTKEIFFKKINVNFTDDELKHLKSCSIDKKISVNTTDKTLKVTFCIDDFLDVKFLKTFEDKIDSCKNYNIKFSFIVNNKKYNKETIWSYISYIKENKAEYKNGAINSLDFKSIEFIEEECKVIFIVSCSVEKELILEHIDYYKNKLIKYGFSSLNLEIKVLENHVEILEEINNEYESIVVNNENKKTNTNIKPQVKTKFKSNNLVLDKPDYKTLLDLEENSQNITIHGQVISKDVRKSKANRNIYNISITDKTSSINCIFFQKNDEPTYFDNLNESNQKYLEDYKEELINVNDWVSFNGNYSYSPYDKSYIFYINKYKKIPSKEMMRKDDADKKRVELHVHTKMSVMDGVSSIKDYLSAANSFGWNAIAVTDHLNVQSFPEAYNALKSINKGKNNSLKLIYGSELNLLNEDFWIVKHPKNQDLRKAKFVVFDLETTGLSPEYDEIIEFGANVYDYDDGTSKRHDILIKPSKPISKFTTELTNITNEMLSDKNNIEVEFKNILNIIEDGILIAHNANFDFNFLQSWAKKLGYDSLSNTVIDTLTLSRVLKPELKNHRLGSVAKAFGIIYDEKNAHRADYDAEVLTNVYEHMWTVAKKNQSIDFDIDWNKFIPLDNYKNEHYKRIKGYHVNVLAKNQEGLKDLYKLISYSHVKNFLNSPKIFKSVLLEYKNKNNILVGSSCQNSEVFDLARTGTDEMLEESIKFYDYIEVQPINVYKKFLLTNDLDIETLKKIIMKIINISRKNNIKVIASSDAHYVNPEDKIIRDIYINTKGLGGVYHPLYDFKQRVTSNPDQHLRTTDEMLNEFNWLDKDLAYEIVVTNSNFIADLVEPDIKPLKEGLYTPKIDNAEKLLKDECFKNAKKIYGENLPSIVLNRLNKELDSITKHGFSVIYWISHLLVKKSNDDGYLVGSRGSVGSSLVATLSNITEVNPLRAHYICKKCKYSNFEVDQKYKCGFDLPKEACPNCGEYLIGDGHDIPFETFLGFDGDKIPDIDLNFSGEYQGTAHNFIKDLFGKENVFRAGTISTVAEKTAYGYVLGHFEKSNIPTDTVRKAEVNRLASLATGVKRTTGQHPGGIIILPKEFEIEDFTPVNFPADDYTSDWLTTHFDFHSIHDNLLKMDVLGHVDPTALRMLKDLTNVDPINIPVNDEKVYTLFSNLSALNISSSDINGETTGALGLPEFGTQFVRGMLKETQPKTFADLVQISGLSHGTDVYLGNAQTLIQNNIADISSVIGCRDEIMVYLMSMGLDDSVSFKIMEDVRKGKGLNKDYIEIMRKNNVPEWYINSCQKIKYMFPKAHATAYVLMAYRVAYYKIYFPEEYYATWFSTRADFFDIETALSDKETVLRKINEIKSKQNNKEPVSAKEAGLLPVYEVILEMFARKISFKNIDFNISEATTFKIKSIDGVKYIYPSFNVIDSLGETVAKSIVNARNEKQIITIDDLKKRTQVTQTQIEIFKKLDILSSLKDDNQISFDF
ncbi:PolC-type DNA polymerase III [Spiroplasma turonicum]|uniref:DNA polymerase III PolC-type n=1 Tax=Spiroplasma turonicum TaxID=216946 RepID=A0A0K1P6M7_9MOLU|nr:PolC-type DNA polymerase III [Spiroplasma turonicum]AKU79512.1 DNA polymerase III subunit alpha (PolC) [Spiroplasma turonicum]ALX70535.1 DNA polymerase III subunit alpha (PolC) [Spiroplasma turonicum]